jgi:GT2 family glycosyltransferase
METLPLTRYVTFMDADDLWEPRALKTMFEVLELRPDAVGVHGLAETIDGEGRPLAVGNFSAFGRRRLGYRNGRISEWPICEPTRFETLVWTGPLYPPGLLLARREAYEKAGLYDTRLLQCEDWDMCLRLSRHGCIVFLNEVLLSYRRHQTNLSNDVRGNREAVRRLHRKTFFSSENSSAQREMLKKGWKAWQWFKMQEKWREAKGYALRGAPLRGLRTVVDFPVHLLRYARGYPSKTGF